MLLDAPPSAGGAIDAERLYVPLQTGGLRAYARETGDLQWVEAVQTTLPPVVGDGLLFVATPDAVQGHEAATGNAKWVTPMADVVTAPMAWQPGRLIAATQTGEIVAMRTSDGVVLWRHPAGTASVHPAAQPSPDMLAYTLADGTVLALDAMTGEVRWRRRLPGTLSAPAAARDRVFVGSTSNFFYALDAESGDIEWQWRTGGDVIGAASEGDRVFFASLDNVLRAVNRDNGNQVWKTAVPTRPSRPPIAFGGVVVLTGVAPRLDAYVGETGAALGSYTAPGEQQGPAAHFEGAPLLDVSPKPYAVALVLLTRNGRIIALRPTKLAFPDPPLVPLPRLPGRELPREPRPLPRSPVPTSTSPRPE